MSKAELRAYSYTLSFDAPTVNILVPSLLKVTPIIVASWELRVLVVVALTLLAVVSNPVETLYSLIWVVFSKNHFVPSLLNAMDWTAKPLA